MGSSVFLSLPIGRHQQHRGRHRSTENIHGPSAALCSKMNDTPSLQHDHGFFVPAKQGAAPKHAVYRHQHRRRSRRPRLSTACKQTYPDLHPYALLHLLQEYITSLITYTVRSADQGYYRTGVDDEGEVDYTSPRAIGPEYQRLLTHKTALEGLSTLLNQQTVTLSKHKEAQLEQRSRLGWWGNMVNISGKVSQWSKETKWVDSAFVKQEQLANAWTPGP